MDGSIIGSAASDVATASSLGRARSRRRRISKPCTPRPPLRLPGVGSGLLSVMRGSSVPLQWHVAATQDILAFESVLSGEGLHAALAFLNQRTAFRFTGLYRFDGDMLRNVALFDRWHPAQTSGEDAPTAQTFCAIVGDLLRPLEVVDGRTDDRFPWMKQNAVVSYCGVPVFDDRQKAVGTLCHFDLRPCQAAISQLPLMEGAAEMLLPYVLGVIASKPGQL